MSLEIGQIGLPSNTSERAKAGRNGLEIYLILDESGSMSNILDDTITSSNSFIEEQLKEQGTFVSVVTFNSYSKKIINRENNPHVAKITRQNYVPGGGTALNDAVGDTLTEINNRLFEIPEEDRPGILVCIITDGDENASKKFNNSQIKVMVEDSTSKNWAFTFLGANIDAFKVGAGYGFSAGQTASFSTQNMGATMASASAYAATTRSAILNNVDVSTVSYSDAQRHSMVSKTNG